MFFPIYSYARDCSPGKVLARLEWGKYDNPKINISIPDFQNENKGHSWLSIGLAELLGNYFASGKHISISKGLILKHPQQTIPPTYTVTGSFSENSTSLNVKIQVSGKGKNYSTGFALSPPNSGRLFIEISKAAKNILDHLDINYNKKDFRNKVQETANYLSYQGYIKAIEAVRKFDPNYIEVAQLWFQEAKKNDMYFQAPYEANANMYGFLALISKINEKPYSEFIEIMTRIENERMRQISRPSPLDKNRMKIKKLNKELIHKNTFLVANKFYQKGIDALNSGDLKKARDELERVSKILPEDTKAMKALYNVYIRLEKQNKANDILNKMNKYNICN